MKPCQFLTLSLLLTTILSACRPIPTPAQASPPTLPSPPFTVLPPSATLSPTLPITLSPTAIPSATATFLATATLPATLEPTPSATAAQPPRPWRIMPLGDSLTSGTYPGRVHSYRGYLEQMLTAAGYSFDFVGTQSWLAHGGSDPDHEGHSGFTIGPDERRDCEGCPTANLYDHLEDYLQAEPDIVLLLIGINDLIPQEVSSVSPADAPARLAGLVQRLQALRPQTYIFVASLAPVNYTDSSNVPAYQAVNQMAGQLGAADPNDRIYFVDINGALEPVIDRKTDFADGVHLAEGGARKMAQVWFDALVASGLLAQSP